MSRSYKKTPRCGDQKDKIYKRISNKKVRKCKDTLNNKSYKKLFCSYDICDYETVGETFNQYYERAVSNWYRYGWKYGDPFPDKRKVYQEYMRWFKRK